MRIVEIEHWAIDVIRRVEAHQPIEDARVELKRDWPADHAKAARRIAGHANAARGEPVLWLIGVDENKGAVGVAAKEMSSWFDKVKSRFDGVPPTLRDVNVPTPKGTVVALYFETDRAPFVIRNESGKGPEREVPWREGTKVRSATRSDLVRLLVPTIRLPEFDIVDAVLTATEGIPRDGEAQVFWELSVHSYVTPRTADTIVIPLNRCATFVSVPGWEIENLQLLPTFRASDQSRTVEAAETEAILYGPGTLHVDSYEHVKGILRRDAPGPGLIRVLLRPAWSDVSVDAGTNIDCRRQEQVLSYGEHRWQTRWSLRAE